MDNTSRCFISNTKAADLALSECFLIVNGISSNKKTLFKIWFIKPTSTPLPHPKRFTQFRFICLLAMDNNLFKKLWLWFRPSFKHIYNLWHLYTPRKSCSWRVDMISIIIPVYKCNPWTWNKQFIVSSVIFVQEWSLLTNILLICLDVEILSQCHNVSTKQNRIKESWSQVTDLLTYKVTSLIHQACLVPCHQPQVAIIIYNLVNYTKIILNREQYPLVK